jgi:Icc-related predicted phosphoesterase
MIKLVLISDSHGRHDNIYVFKPGDSLKRQETLNNINGGVWLPEEADIIAHSGDMSMMGSEFEIDNFLKWYSKLPYKHKLLIAGNHDFLFERQRMIARELLERYPEITYLETSEVVIEGIKFYGEPRQPEFHDFAFNVPRGEKIKRYWDAIPDDVNIIITHGPPKGILDMTMRGKQVGCEDLLYRLWELKELKLVQFGHIHEHAGHEFINDVHFVNASVVNVRLQLQNKPQIFEIDENKNIKKIE